MYPELNIKKEKLSEIKTISQKEINNHLMKSKLLIQNNKLTINQKAEIYIKRNKKYSTSNCINEFNIKKIIRS